MTDPQDTPQQSQNVTTGPEIHPWGLHAESVRWRLPYGGNLVVRVEQDKRDAHRFRAMIAPGHVAGGTRAEVLAAIEGYARETGDREVRRREGSTDPADHANPPGNITGRDLWLHLHECYGRWLAGGGRGHGLPSSQVQMIHASNIVGALPWEEQAGERQPHPDLDDASYRAAYRMHLAGWAEAEAVRRNYEASRDAWGW